MERWEPGSTAPSYAPSGPARGEAATEAFRTGRSAAERIALAWHRRPLPTLAAVSSVRLLRRDDDRRGAAQPGVPPPAPDTLVDEPVGAGRTSRPGAAQF